MALGVFLVPWLLLEERGTRALPLAAAVATLWVCLLLCAAAVADVLPRLGSVLALARARRRRLLGAAASAVVVWAAGVAALATSTPSREAGGLAAGTALLLIVEWRAARLLLDRAPRVLVIGSAEFQAALVGEIHATGRRIVGRLDLRTTVPKQGAHEAPDHDEVVIEPECISRLSDVPSQLRLEARRVYVSDPDGFGALPHGGAFGSPLPLLGDAFKRAVDLAAASTLLVLAAPVLCLSALAIRLDSPGGVMFGQTRVGRDGRHFTIYKLRTMLTGASDREHKQYVASLIEGRGQAQGGVFKMVDDPRMTRVGRWLRRSSIDELPQLWNVLTGSMSLVGPRPSLPDEVELYTPAMFQRTRVKPGMTGLWQVSGRSRLSFDEMVALDVRYWRSWSLSLEIGILLRTPLVVLTGRGAA